MGMGCNRNKGGFFGGYEAFWIIVVIAIVIIWVHCCHNAGGCGCDCGFDDCCGNNCCGSCCSNCC